MATKHSFQVSVPKRQTHCTASGVRFVSDMEYYSLLFENEEGEQVREDYALPAWATYGKARVGEVDGIYWKARVPTKKEDKPKPQTQDEKALALLKQNLASKDEACQAEAFVLALFLRRRKALIHRKEVKRKRRGFILYEVSGTEEMLTVPTFTLHELQTDQIQETLAGKLLEPEDGPTEPNVQELSDPAEEGPES